MRFGIRVRGTLIRVDLDHESITLMAEGGSGSVAVRDQSFELEPGVPRRVSLEASGGLD